MRLLPNYSKCFLCGDKNPKGLNLRFEAREGKVFVRARLDDGTMGFQGLVHGGIISALLDETMGWAATVVKRQFCLCAELSVRFVEPLPVGALVVVTGQMTRDRGRVWETEGDLCDEHGCVYARARGKYMPMSDVASREVDGYLSYPEGQESVLEGPGDESG
ncbi:MAG: PaaI family thioesterase [Planctomycetota bacterium]